MPGFCSVYVQYPKGWEEKENKRGRWTTEKFEGPVDYAMRFADNATKTARGAKCHFYSNDGRFLFTVRRCLFGFGWIVISY